MMRWHRIIGLITGILIVVLALSGIALTHSTQLGLDRRTITAPWLLSWMGAQSDAEIYFYALGPHSVAILDDRVFFDGVMIAQTLEGGVGAVKIANAIAVAGKSEILLLTENGALIERVTALPVPVTGIGVTQDGRVAVALTPDLVFTSDDALLEWRQVTDQPVIWAAPGLIPAAIREQILQGHRGAGLSTERIMLELHSGRIFGNYGPWLMDGAALAMLALAATGVTGWIRGRKRGDGSDAR